MKPKLNNQKLQMNNTINKMNGNNVLKNKTHKNISGDFKHRTERNHCYALNLCFCVKYEFMRQK